MAVPARARAATRRLVSNIMKPYSARDPSTMMQDNAVPSCKSLTIGIYTAKRGQQSMEPGLIAEHPAYIVCSRTYCRPAGRCRIRLEKTKPHNQRPAGRYSAAHTG